MTQNFWFKAFLLLSLLNTIHAYTGCIIDSERTYEWVCEPNEDANYFSAVASAPRTPGGLKIDYVDALDNATPELSVQIEHYIQGKLELFRASSKLNSQQEFDLFSQQLAKEAAKASISQQYRSKTLELWEHPRTHVQYFHIKIEKQSVMATAKSMLHGKLQAYQGLLSELESKKLLKKLELSL